MNWALVLSNASFTAIGIQALAFILAAIGVNVHFGFTGLLNFGQAAFAAVGAYTYSVMILEHGFHWWSALLMVFPMAILLALLLGIPTLRLRADYLAIVTIAAAEILRQVLISPRLDKRYGIGGSDGLQGFTRDLEKINPWNDKTFHLWKQPFDGHQGFIMFIGWILVALCSLFVYLLMRSPWGRVLKSIREDEDAARSLGKNVFSYKMQSLMIGGVIGALGGVVLAVGGRAAAPNDYSTTFTFFAWTMLILGGAGKIKAPIVGGIIFWFVIGFSDQILDQATRRKYLPRWLVDQNNYGLLRFMLVGLGLALLVIFRPQGIFGDKREQVFDVR